MLQFLVADRPIVVLLVFVLVFISTIVGCKKGYEDRFGPFYVINDTTAILDGDMRRNVDRKFDQLLEEYPNLRQMQFGECPGSRDDDAMFKAARALREHGINTQISSTSVVESGAVDFFLAGEKRSIEDHAKIGVHAWSDGQKEATDFPEGHEEHQVYIDYYVYCGFPLDSAKAFYYFTINAAGADDLHYMTEEEIQSYGLVSP